MKLHKYKIKNCRSCNSDKISEILTLGDFYLSEFYKTKQKPKKYPLDIVLCKNCFLLQLKYTTPQTDLYTPRYGYKSGINDTMKKELKNIVSKSIKISKNKKNPIVVDIGANDGTLLSFYSKKYFRIGIEPVKKFQKEAAPYHDLWINDYFNYNNFYKKAKNKKADIVTIISCFYDMDNPGSFLEDVIKLLNKDGIIIIQQNYLGEMIKQNAFDNIVHEHLTYYSLLSFENLLGQHGLSVFDVEISPINGGSFRTYITFKGLKKKTHRVYNLRNNEKNINLASVKTYENFAHRVKSIGIKLNKFIKQESERGKTIYVYGASTRGNTLLQYFDLDNKLITKAVERNPEKWGKKISSLNIPIVSENQARAENPDYMLVLPWFFKDEFLKREQNYLKNGGHFIFPLPYFEII